MLYIFGILETNQNMFASSVISMVLMENAATDGIYHLTNIITIPTTRKIIV